MKGEANANFIHHRVTELAKDVLEKSKEEKITDTYFEEVSRVYIILLDIWTLIVNPAFNS